MSLKHAMLGFLNMMPMSGYDLKKMFGASIQYYWPATHSQIYRTLDRMDQAGLVTREIVIQENNPNKKIYHITEKGKKELLGWLVSPQELPAFRHKLLVQLSWADILEDDEIIALLDAYAQKVKARLEIYKSQNRSLIREYARTDREFFLWQATLEHGFMSFENELKWIAKMKKGLKKLKG